MNITRILYEFGNDRLGLAQDYAEAFNWYLRAADQGDANAQLHLGTMYEQGHGVPQDFVLAHMRYNLAAAVQGGYKLCSKPAGQSRSAYDASADRRGAEVGA